MAELFGFEIKRKGQEETDEKKKVSFVPPETDDGLGQVINAGGYFGSYLDMDASSAKTEKELIMKYRDASFQPECDAAIEDIINEAVVSDTDGAPVKLILDDLDQPAKIKKLMLEEFETVVNLLNFSWYGHEIFRRWYVDSKLYYHKIIDNADPKRGLIEVRPIDATKIRKVKEVEHDTDKKTGVKIVKDVKEYYIYQN